MLQRLLELVAEGGVHSHAELARQLKVSDKLLAEIIEDLARRGYLRAVSGDCSGQCAGCHQSKTCAVGASTQIWSLTEKGNAAATRAAAAAAD